MSESLGSDHEAAAIYADSKRAFRGCDVCRWRKGFRAYISRANKADTQRNMLLEFQARCSPQTYSHTIVSFNCNNPVGSSRR